MVETFRLIWNWWIMTLSLNKISDLFFFFFNNLMSRLKRIPCCVYTKGIHLSTSIIVTYYLWRKSVEILHTFLFFFLHKKNNKHNFIIFLNKHNWGQCWCTCIVTISFIHKTRCIDGTHQFKEELLFFNAQYCLKKETN